MPYPFNAPDAATCKQLAKAALARYECAANIDISHEQALDMLRRHGITKDPHGSFQRECWDAHSNNGRIQVQRVLLWLGY